MGDLCFNLVSSMEVPYEGDSAINSLTGASGLLEVAMGHAVVSVNAVTSGTQVINEGGHRGAPDSLSSLLIFKCFPHETLCC